MFDDELAYDEELNRQLEKAEQEALQRGEMLQSLVQHPGYQIAKKALADQYFSRVPAVPNSEAGMHEAFGQMKIRQGIQMVFDYIEGAVANKNQFSLGD